MTESEDLDDSQSGGAHEGSSENEDVGAVLQTLREELVVAENRIARTRGQREELESEAQLLGEKAVSTKEAYEAAIEKERDSRSELKALKKEEKTSAEAVDELQMHIESIVVGQTVAFDTGENPVELLSQKKKALEIIRKEKEELSAKLRKLADEILTAEAAALAANTTSGLCMSKAEAAVLAESEAIETYNALKKEINTLAGSQQEDVETAALQEAAAMEQQEMLDDLEMDKASDASLISQMRSSILTFAANNRVLVATAGIAACVMIGIVFQRQLSEIFSWVYEKLMMIPEQIANFEEGTPKPEPTEPGLKQTLWLLATSIVTVPVFMKLPGGSDLVGFLMAGLLIGPHALGLISNVHQAKHIAEIGVVFMLFNIGLHLTYEKLNSMKKLVFGLGATQVFMSAAGLVAALSIGGQAMGSAAMIVAAGLALSSTAVAMQVLSDRGETSSRYGGATFSVLLFQDLAVIAILLLVPLLGGTSNGGNASILETTKKLSKALAVAVIKAMVACTAIVVTGKAVLNWFYKQISALDNPPLFAATTLFFALGTSVLTQQAGLSMALGAVLAGMLIAETDYHLQVESDILPFKGLLLGLFFMTVGMEISLAVLASEWVSIVIGIVVLITIKLGSVALLGPIFGVPRTSAIRAGLLLAPGGEFAFVIFGEAVREGILSSAYCSKLFIIVGISMALTPYLARLGQIISSRMQSRSSIALQPTGGEFDGMKDHVVVLGWGRIGKTICGVLAEKAIPFVAIDVRIERVNEARSQDLRVYFGDAGSPTVLEKIRARDALCAIVTLDSPAANYRAVSCLKREFPHLPTYCRARDVDHGKQLERAGAKVVVPETLEPSLLLAEAAMRGLYSEEEVDKVISAYRKEHIAELQGGEDPEPLLLAATPSVQVRSSEDRDMNSEAVP